MTERDKQRQLDALAMRYLAAVDAGDFDTIDALWAATEHDDALSEMLHGLNAEIRAAQDLSDQAAIAEHVSKAIEAHMPSAEVLRPATGPLTVAEVADHLRRHPPHGLTIDDLRLNDALRTSSMVVPGELGVSQVVAWGRQFGTAPDAYWKAFRVAALKLLGQRESAENHQMAARPGKPKATGGKS